jgi:hypothetical protein
VIPSRVANDRLSEIRIDIPHSTIIVIFLKTLYSDRSRCIDRIYLEHSTILGSEDKQLHVGRVATCGEAADSASFGKQEFSADSPDSTFC